MTFLRWCEFCQKKTAHHTESLPPGVIWGNGVRREYDPDWQEVWCHRCKGYTMDYLADIEDPTPSEEIRHTLNTTV